MSQLKKNRSRIRLFSGAVIMLVLTLGFNMILTSATLEKLYIETVLSKNNVVAQDLQRNLETALRFGKSVDKFIGMDKLILEAWQHLAPKQKKTSADGTGEDDIVVSITDPDGHIVYSSSAPVVGTNLPEAARLPMVKGTQTPVESHAVKHEGIYYLSLPVEQGFSKKWVATITVAFNQKQIKTLLRTIVMKNRNLIALVLFSAMGLIVIFLRSLNLDPSISKKSLGRIKFKISAAFFIIICLAQISLNLFNLFEFKAHFLDVSTQKSVVISEFLKQDIEYLLAKGLNIRRLNKMDQKLADVIAVSPELEAISISDTKGQPLYIATQHGMRNLTMSENNKSSGSGTLFLKSDPDGTVTQDLLNTRESKTDALAGKLTIHISKDFLFNKLKAIALDSITVLVISIFFFVELLILERQLIDRQIMGDTPAHRRQVHYTSIRPVAFIFFFGVDTCISFLPLHMAILYNPSHPLLGLSQNIIMGLPISMQMLFTSMSLLISGAWCDKRGWAEPFLIGLFLSGTGFICAWLTSSSLYFLIALGLVGMGYGLSLMAAQGFVIAHTTTKNSAQGMAQLWAGVYAGSICGGATGAMLADRMGYAPVFLVGGSILLLLIVYTFFMMKDAMKRPRPPAHVPRPSPTGQTLPSSRKPSVYSFLFNRKVFTLIVFYGLPWYIVLIGFMNYYSPIYLKGIGVSQSSIGRIFMIYGICLMYVAPYISKIAGQAHDKKRYLVMGSFIGSLSIANFYFFKDLSGVISVTVSIFLLGLSACMIPVRSAYVLDIYITKQLGGGKAIGISNAILRLGQVVGPILFGWLFITMGSDSGMAATAAAYLLFTLIFIFVG
ncbi:MFS transporter [Desulfobacter hydrogenophilus]|uniref:MFS transporter n=1 Tax=Desulfobacter hydrogenophilus TaxID=2291 RepID=A0A328FEU1_9BACT|nr:MFS transporter [Desulfobacter hydrogenophilus]NDY70809.1 MFS transporter [Desulfobacter hydrogenophilus]QBH11581.1 MFS transporter [Desulfobacter hydrogenophilus]RAM03128.1 MFS transporter [Desulfobacter hydrogenophilus]